ncbi:DUF2182 domain-containing protein [Pusillimonas sp. TS35]|uniref:DUF2182 domain-containing protein n=1 Tax=Paracandidimonas lactea TaxID=2895524 RepID=UPI001368BC63|nr:DUF2182 domain-containing protein [Paracandidimonas lactea]MYN12797.1 DUF2182 domain-containing protein [Pusillimonas sp. TS35]
MNGTLLERALRHDRIVVIGSLSVLVLLSWGYLIFGMAPGQEMPAMMGEGIGMAPMTGDSMDMRAMPNNGTAMAVGATPWAPARWIAMVSMWLVMMAAMMLPSAAPMILLYARISRRHALDERPTLGAYFFVLGYAVIWGLGSFAAVVLQYWLEMLTLLSPAMTVTSTALAGSLLIAAGVYQWMPLKHACLRRCRSPLDFLLTYWRPGSGGAFIMGAQHGLYCVGCCWLIMLLLFVGGIMNLYWIAGLAFYVLVEKLFPGGPWIGRIAGVVLIGWGMWTLLALR